MFLIMYTNTKANNFRIKRPLGLFVHMSALVVETHIFLEIYSISKSIQALYVIEFFATIHVLTISFWILVGIKWLICKCNKTKQNKRWSASLRRSKVYEIQPLHHYIGTYIVKAAGSVDGVRIKVGERWDWGESGFRLQLGLGFGLRRVGVVETWALGWN